MRATDATNLKIMINNEVSTVLEYARKYGTIGLLAIAAYHSREYGGIRNIRSLAAILGTSEINRRLKELGLEELLEDTCEKTTGSNTTTST